MQFLLDHGIMIPLEHPEKLKKGNIIRRVGHGKDQQGAFVCHDDADGLVLVNVIDMVGVSFAAEAGVLRPASGDDLYVFIKSFASNPLSRQAREIIERWALYRRHKDLARPIMTFVQNAFAPEQIIDFERTDNLKFVFVPIQQKFKIGRFEETVNWELERKQRFRKCIEGMKVGDHITYVALIPHVASYSPLFYSIGTQPHESTHMSLASEPFNFKPNLGGHIKRLKTDDGSRRFLVDAGSNFLGKGTLSSMDTAKSVTKGMKTVYGEFEFEPVAGRGAFGEEQSY